MGTVAALCVASVVEPAVELLHRSCLETDSGSTLVDSNLPLARRGGPGAPANPHAAYSVARFADGIVRIASVRRPLSRSAGGPTMS